MQSINVSGHKYGLVYPGVGWIVWRDSAALPEDLIFRVDYLGGEMPTFALNFSRPGAQVAAQYYSFVRLGSDGYRLVHQASRETAQWLAAQVDAMAAFDLISVGDGIPAFAFRVSDQMSYSVYDVSESLRGRGWIVPAYPMPPAGRRPRAAYRRPQRVHPRPGRHVARRPRPRRRPTRGQGLRRRSEITHRVPPLMGRWRGALVACAALMSAAGCGSGTTKTTSATTVTTTDLPTTTTSLPAATTTPPPTTNPYATTPVSVPGEGATALLKAVRTAAQNGFDRVTFEFANRLPGYTVGYVERPVIQDASGAEVTVKGSAVLRVAMKPASSADLSSGGRATYTGPNRFDPGTSALAELVQVGDFEGYLTWVIGVPAEAGFHVWTLDAPPRLVVDVQAG